MGKHLELFNAISFYCDECYVASIAELWSFKCIRRLFKLFKELFPNHPSKDNTGLYILYNSDLRWWSVLWACEHFEHSSTEDLTKIAAFAHEFEREFSGNAYLELLNGHSEKIVLCILDSRSKLIKRMIRKMRKIG